MHHEFQPGTTPPDQTPPNQCNLVNTKDANKSSVTLSSLLKLRFLNSK